MKIKLLLASMALFSVCANAASDNTVHFQGEVSSQTCNVNINGNSASPIVLLPTIAASEFENPADVKGATTFTIGVSDCATGAASIKTVFAGNNITTTGNLGNTGTAKNVSIQLLDSNGTDELEFANGTTVSTAAFTKAEGATSATQTLTAQYYAEPDSTTTPYAVSAGTVVASAQYSITYN